MEQNDNFDKHWASFRLVLALKKFWPNEAENSEEH